MKQTILCLFVVIILLASQMDADELLSGGSSEILPVDAAFRFSFGETEDRINLFWQIQPGYFLYRDKFSVVINDQSQELIMAEGKWYLDENFGRVQVLEEFVRVQIPKTSEEVSVYYQGCAAIGYCYPPQIELINSSKMQLKSGNELRWGSHQNVFEARGYFGG